MDHPRAVRRGERVTELPRSHAPREHPGDPPRVLFETRLQKLHAHPRSARRGLDARSVHLHHVVVLDVRAHPRLAFPILAQFRASGHFGEHHFERDALPDVESRLPKTAPTPLRANRRTTWYRFANRAFGGAWESSASWNMTARLSSPCARGGATSSFADHIVRLATLPGRYPPRSRTRRREARLPPRFTLRSKVNVDTLPRSCRG